MVSGYGSRGFNGNCAGAVLATNDRIIVGKEVPWTAWAGQCTLAAKG